MMKKDAAGSRVLKYVTAGAAAGVLLFSSLVPRMIPQTWAPQPADRVKAPAKAGPGVLPVQAAGRSGDEPVVLRVANWEEYIDLGDWDEEETIELPSGDIIGENSMIEDFEIWYEETYGKKVRVEYSTFGTNEDLYNMLTLGDVYDLVCPSEYLIMKLMAEGETVPLSEQFFDTIIIPAACPPSSGTCLRPRRSTGSPGPGTRPVICGASRVWSTIPKW